MMEQAGGATTVADARARLLATARPDRPYPGLRPFEMDEWSIFFGRGQMIEDVVSRLAERQLVMVHGGSGSGKSSLVRAGVLPRLARHSLRHGRPWQICVMRPSGGPWWNLARAFAGLEGRAEDATRVADIRREFDRAGARLSDIAGASAHDGGLCLLIDQFEELFRYDHETSRDESELFVRLLVGLLDERDSRVDLRTVLTMRSEFLGNCGRFDGLAEAVNTCQYLLPRLEREALRVAIRRPAEMYGGIVEPALVDRLIDDADGTSDELPLIQHGMMQLWQEAQTAAGAGKPRLDLALYAERGDLAKRLSDHADQVMARVAEDPAGTAIVRTVFRALTDINADSKAIRRPQSFAELAAVSGAPEQRLRTILDAYRDRDVAFLMPYAPEPITDTTRLDIGHEALIRNWRRIVGAPPPHKPGDDIGWLREEFDDGLVWRSLAIQAQAYKANPGNVLALATLLDRERWLEGHNRHWCNRYGGGWDDVQTLLAQSALHHKEAEREKAEAAARELRLIASRRRANRIWAAAAMVLILLAGMVGLWAGREYEAAERRYEKALQEVRVARQGQSNYMVQVARETLAKGDVDKALALALEALPRDMAHLDRPYLVDAERTLFSVVVESRPGLVLRMNSPVRIVAFSPNGGQILTVSSDDKVRIWDAKSGVELRALPHPADVRSAAFSPDGTQLLTVSVDRKVRIWATEAGSEPSTVLDHKDSVLSASFSPDGATLLTVDRTARLWDARSGKQLTEYGGAERLSLAAFSPDGRRMLTASIDGTVTEWDIATRALLTKLVGHRGVVTRAVYSPDGRRALTASEDQTARLWQLDSAQSTVFEGHSRFVIDAMFSPDGQRVLTTSVDNSAIVWESSTGRRLYALPNRGNGVLRASFSPDGQSILMWAALLDTRSAVPTGQPVEYIVRILNAANGEPMTTVGGHSDQVYDASFSPDGRQILTASADGTARLSSLEGGYGYVVLRGHSGSVFEGAFAPDGTKVATVSEDGTARIWDAMTGKQLFTLAGHDGAVTGVAFSPDGSRIATTSDDATARLWDAVSGTSLAIMRGHKDLILSVAFSPDGKRIVTASADHTARLWSAADGQQERVMVGHSEWVSKATFSPDGARILTASDDKTARLWEAATGKLLFTLPEQANGVLEAIFSPDGRRFLTISLEGVAGLWDAGDGKQLAVFGDNTRISDAAFSRDGQRILTWDRDRQRMDRSVRIWDATQAKVLLVLKGHTGGINRASFSRDGSRVLTSSQDRTARIWNSENGQELRILSGHLASVSNAIFAPNDDRVLTVSQDRTARLWNVFRSSQGLIDYACTILRRPLSVDERTALFLESEPRDPPCGWHAGTEKPRPDLPAPRR